ncbi:putative inorganic diphosphatase [Aspergillus thermomutatus]|uniref:inorganic diphosphatase n=1 Tax=Aspergillus thermomutatus TaxID=41047 RepID=A0A397H5E4_ASPTH|nr:uncharacterized protein CDV56_105590 [Aspergillus thermomutatus]RHZ57919.1 hypothetical protein CDV56_105590 [Aspergillus thermomutatus]
MAPYRTEGSTESTHETDFVESYVLRPVGKPLTKEYRVYFTLNDKIFSPWHDLALYPGGREHLGHREPVVHMVVEVPRWWSAKMEIAKDEYLNPLKQDIQDGRLKYVPNIFPHKGYPFNYGMLPQTYQDPGIDDPLTQLPADGNPLAVCELGGAMPHPAQIKRVKVLGSLAVINENKTDWKIIVVDLDNPEADKLSDIGDVELLMPGYLDTIKEWFRVYKLAEGKQENVLGANGELQNQKYTLSLIERCHNSWKAVKVEPDMQARVSMADIAPHEHGAVDVLPRKPENRDVACDIDPIAAEKSHFLSPNWPSMAACRGGALNV